MTRKILRKEKFPKVVFYSFFFFLLIIFFESFFFKVWIKKLIEKILILKNLKFIIRRRKVLNLYLMKIMLRLQNGWFLM